MQSWKPMQTSHYLINVLILLPWRVREKKEKKKRAIPQLHVDITSTKGHFTFFQKLDHLPFWAFKMGHLYNDFHWDFKFAAWSVSIKQFFSLWRQSVSMMSFPLSGCRKVEFMFMADRDGRERKGVMVEGVLRRALYRLFYCQRSKSLVLSIWEGI